MKHPKSHRKAKTTLADAPAMPPPEARRRFLTLEEWGRVMKKLSARPLRDRALICVMYEAGLRRSEPGVLRGSYLDQLDKNKLYVWRGKGSNSGHVVLTPETSKLLRQWADGLWPLDVAGIPDTEPVFPGYGGRGIAGRTVYDIWAALALEAELPEKLRFPHVLKHSRCQHLLEHAREAKGGHPMDMLQVIAELVGHASAMTTIANYMKATGWEQDFAMKVTRKLVKG
jgi:integrase